MKAKARFWCPAIEWTAMQGPPILNYWAFRSWRYLYALSGLPVCAISSLPKASLDLSTEKSPWFELRGCFGFQVTAEQRLAGGPVEDPLDTKYVNIVCGIGDDAHRLYTVGVPNLAITGVFNGTGVLATTEAEIASLKKYDAVICPTGEDASFYKSRFGIDAVYVPADPVLLNPLIERLRAL